MEFLSTSSWPAKAWAVWLSNETIVFIFSDFAETSNSSPVASRLDLQRRNESSYFGDSADGR